MAARRIKYYVKDGDKIEQNAEFGFIRFGSRVDVYFPVGTKIGCANWSGSGAAADYFGNNLIVDEQYFIAL